MIMQKHDRIMEAVLDKIEIANETELNNIILAVQERYKKLSADWDVVYMAIPKGDPQKRKELLQHAFDMVDKELCCRKMEQPNCFLQKNTGTGFRFLCFAFIP